MIYDIINKIRPKSIKNKLNSHNTLMYDYYSALYDTIETKFKGKRTYNPISLYDFLNRENEYNEGRPELIISNFMKDVWDIPNPEKDIDMYPLAMYFACLYGDMEIPTYDEIKDYDFDTHLESRPKYKKKDWVSDCPFEPMWNHFYRIKNNAMDFYLNTFLADNIHYYAHRVESLSEETNFEEEFVTVFLGQQYLFKQNGEMVFLEEKAFLNPIQAKKYSDIKIIEIEARLSSQYHKDAIENIPEGTIEK